MSNTHSQMENSQSKIRSALAEPQPRSHAADIVGYAVSVATTAIATFLAFGLNNGVHIPNLSLVFVIPVIIAGMRYGLGPSLLAAVLGALSYNFFFVEPRYSLSVEDPANIWAIALLLAVGTIISTIAYAARRKETAIVLMKKEIGILQAFSEEIRKAEDRDTILLAAAQALSATFQRPALVFLLRDGTVGTFKAVGDVGPTSADFAAAKLAIEADASSRAQAYPISEAMFEFWPVNNTYGPPAAIGIALGPDGLPQNGHETIDIIKTGLALALDRKKLRAKLSALPRD